MTGDVRIGWAVAAFSAAALVACAVVFAPATCAPVTTPGPAQPVAASSPVQNLVTERIVRVEVPVIERVIERVEVPVVVTEYVEVEVPVQNLVEVPVPTGVELFEDGSYRDLVSGIGGCVIGAACDDEAGGMVGPASIMAALETPCASEDSTNCYWRADIVGNGGGESFLNVEGHIFPLASVLAG
jgi:hypothetical protein